MILDRNPITFVGFLQIFQEQWSSSFTVKNIQLRKKILNTLNISKEFTLLLNDAFDAMNGRRFTERVSADKWEMKKKQWIGLLSGINETESFARQSKEILNHFYRIRVQWRCE